MRTFKVWPIITVCVAAYAHPLLVSAQPPEGNAPPPPTMENLEEGEAPAITIRKPEQQNRITEKRGHGGKVTEVKVTSGKSTYYLKPNDPAGSGMPNDVQNGTNRAAQWEVLNFDLSPAKEAMDEQEEADVAATPEPPVVPVSTTQPKPQKK